MTARVDCYEVTLHDNEFPQCSNCGKEAKFVIDRTITGRFLPVCKDCFYNTTPGILGEGYGYKIMLKTNTGGTDG